MAAYDYIAVARKIAHELSQSGHADWSNRILDAISSGSTGTEILMGVRWNLQELRKSSVRISEPMKAEIADLMSNTDELLK